MSNNFSVDISKFLNGMSDFDTRVIEGVRMIAEQGGLKLVAYSKAHAKWVNRTGEARRRLKYEVTRVPNGWRITFGHGVDYGIFLEKAHEGKYAILQDALITISDAEIMPALKKFLKNVGGK